jgi:tetratricopeptide (TPR) repeat protein
MLDERLHLTRELVVVAAGPQPTRWAYMAHLFRQEDLLEFGDIDGARIEAKAMRRLAETTNSDAIMAIALSMQATHDIADGAFSEANQNLFASRSLDEKVGINSNSETRFLVQLLVLRWHEGRIADVEEDFQRLRRNNPSYTGMWVPLALIYAEAGRLDDARATLRDWLEHEPLANIPKDHIWWLKMVCLSYAAVAVDDRQLARELMRIIQPYQNRNASHWSAISFGSVSLLLAKLAGCVGDPMANQYVESALAFNVRTRQRSWVAHTRLEYARIVTAFDPSDERAKESLRAARADAIELGMSQLRESCEALLSDGPPPLPEVQVHHDLRWRAHRLHRRRRRSAAGVHVADTIQ